MADSSTGAVASDLASFCRRRCKFRMGFADGCRVHLHGAGKLGRQSISAELLQPAELVSGVICQVAVEPELAALLANFLYSNEGGSLYPCGPLP